MVCLLDSKTAVKYIFNHLLPQVNEDVTASFHLCWILSKVTRVVSYKQILIIFSAHDDNGPRDY